MAADIASGDPRVALALTLGGRRVREGDPVLMTSAQYHEARAQMSFEREHLTTGGLESVGFSYSELNFQQKHRATLSNAHIVAGNTRYRHGVSAPVS